MDIIQQPIPWYIAGPLITLTMFMLLFIGKKFGMSSNLRTLCAAFGADKTCDFFCFDWRNDRWNLVVILGAAIGGFLAVNFMSGDVAPLLNSEVVNELQDLGFKSAGISYLPTELYGNDILSNPKSIVLLLIGGLLVGFGARYAGGCTSGHAISGLSNLQLPSLIAVVGFFIGGLIMIHLIFPILF